MVVGVTCPTAAVIYVRISKDADGSMLGVARQERDCVELAVRLGWTLAETIVDDDESAYRAGTRPGYNRMIEGIKNGLYDGVIVWHEDRLVRHPKELESFVEVCEVTGVTAFATVAGQTDLSNSDDLFTMRIKGAVARKESDDKSRRLKRKHQELAELGRWPGGIRHYGYDLNYDALGRSVKDGRLCIIENEAAVIRDAATRVLAGETLYSICADLNERNIPTVKGSRWRPTTLKGILTSWTVAGKRSKNGEPVADGLWDPILDHVTHNRIRHTFDRTLGQRRSRVSVLAGGLIRCGACGCQLHTQRKHPSNVRIYACVPGPGKDGCGRISIVAEQVEAHVLARVLERLDHPALWAHINRDDNDDAVSADEQTLTETSARLEELADMYATGDINRAEWVRARKQVTRQRDTAQTRINRHHARTGQSAWQGQSDTLAAAWTDMNIDQRQAVLKVVIDHVCVQPATKRGRGFHPERVTIEWIL